MSRKEKEENNSFERNFLRFKPRSDGISILSISHWFGFLFISSCHHDVFTKKKLRHPGKDLDHGIQSFHFSLLGFAKSPDIRD